MSGPPTMLSAVASKPVGPPMMLSKATEEKLTPDEASSSVAEQMRLKREAEADERKALADADRAEEERKKAGVEQLQARSQQREAHSAGDATLAYVRNIATDALTVVQNSLAVELNKLLQQGTWRDHDADPTPFANAAALCDPSAVFTLERLASQGFGHIVVAVLLSWLPDERVRGASSVGRTLNTLGYGSRHSYATFEHKLDANFHADPQASRLICCVAEAICVELIVVCCRFGDGSVIDGDTANGLIRMSMTGLREIAPAGYGALFSSLRGRCNEQWCALLGNLMPAHTGQVLSVWTGHVEGHATFGAAPDDNQKCELYAALRHLALDLRDEEQRNALSDFLDLILIAIEDNMGNLKKGTSDRKRACTRMAIAAMRCCDSVLQGCNFAQEDSGLCDQQNLDTKIHQLFTKMEVIFTKLDQNWNPRKDQMKGALAEVGHTANLLACTILTRSVKNFYGSQLELFMQKRILKGIYEPAKPEKTTSRGNSVNSAQCLLRLLRGPCYREPVPPAPGSLRRTHESAPAPRFGTWRDSGAASLEEHRRTQSLVEEEKKAEREEEDEAKCGTGGGDAEDDAGRPGGGTGGMGDPRFRCREGGVQPTRHKYACVMPAFEGFENVLFRPELLLWIQDRIFHKKNHRLVKDISQLVGLLSEAVLSMASNSLSTSFVRGLLDIREHKSLDLFLIGLRSARSMMDPATGFPRYGARSRVNMLGSDGLDHVILELKMHCKTAITHVMEATLKSAGVAAFRLSAGSLPFNDIIECGFAVIDGERRNLDNVQDQLAVQGEQRLRLMCLQEMSRCVAFVDFDTCVRPLVQSAVLLHPTQRIANSLSAGLQRAMVFDPARRPEIIMTVLAQLDCVPVSDVASVQTLMDQVSGMLELWTTLLRFRHRQNRVVEEGVVEAEGSNDYPLWTARVEAAALRLLSHTSQQIRSKALAALQATEQVRKAHRELVEGLREARRASGGGDDAGAASSVDGSSFCVAEFLEKQEEDIVQRGLNRYLALDAKEAEGGSAAAGLGGALGQAPTLNKMINLGEIWSHVLAELAKRVVHRAHPAVVEETRRQLYVQLTSSDVVDSDLWQGQVTLLFALGAGVSNTRGVVLNGAVIAGQWQFGSYRDPLEKLQQFSCSLWDRAIAADRVQSAAALDALTTACRAAHGRAIGALAKSLWAWFIGLGSKNSSKCSKAQRAAIAPLHRLMRVLSDSSDFPETVGKDPTLLKMFLNITSDTFGDFVLTDMWHSEREEALRPSVFDTIILIYHVAEAVQLAYSANKDAEGASDAFGDGGEEEKQSADGGEGEGESKSSTAQPAPPPESAAQEMWNEVSRQRIWRWLRTTHVWPHPNYGDADVATCAYNVGKWCGRVVEKLLQMGPMLDDAERDNLVAEARFERATQWELEWFVNAETEGCYVLRWLMAYLGTDFAQACLSRVYSAHPEHAPLYFHAVCDQLLPMDDTPTPSASLVTITEDTTRYLNQVARWGQAQDLGSLNVRRSLTALRSAAVMSAAPFKSPGFSCGNAGAFSLNEHDEAEVAEASATKRRPSDIERLRASLAAGPNFGDPSELRDLQRKKSGGNSACILLLGLRALMDPNGSVRVRALQLVRYTMLARMADHVASLERVGAGQGPTDEARDEARDFARYIQQRSTGFSADSAATLQSESLEITHRVADTLASMDARMLASMPTPDGDEDGADEEGRRGGQLKAFFSELFVQYEMREEWGGHEWSGTIAGAFCAHIALTTTAGADAEHVTTPYGHLFMERLFDLSVRFPEDDLYKCTAMWRPLTHTRTRDRTRSFLDPATGTDGDVGADADDEPNGNLQACIGFLLYQAATSNVVQTAVCQELALVCYRAHPATAARWFTTPLTFDFQHGEESQKWPDVADRIQQAESCIILLSGLCHAGLRPLVPYLPMILNYATLHFPSKREVKGAGTGLALTETRPFKQQHRLAGLLHNVLATLQPLVLRHDRPRPGPGVVQETNALVAVLRSAADTRAFQLDWSHNAACSHAIDIGVDGSSSSRAAFALTRAGVGSGGGGGVVIAEDEMVEQKSLLLVRSSGGADPMAFVQHLTACLQDALPPNTLAEQWGAEALDWALKGPEVDFRLKLKAHLVYQALGVPADMSTLKDLTTQLRALMEEMEQEAVGTPGLRDGTTTINHSVSHYQATIKAAACCESLLTLTHTLGARFHAVKAAPTLFWVGAALLRHDGASGGGRVDPTLRFYRYGLRIIDALLLYANCDDALRVLRATASAFTRDWEMAFEGLVPALLPGVLDSDPSVAELARSILVKFVRSSVAGDVDHQRLSVTDRSALSGGGEGGRWGMALDIRGRHCALMRILVACLPWLCAQAGNPPTATATRFANALRQGLSEDDGEGGGGGSDPLYGILGGVQSALREYTDVDGSAAAELRRAFTSALLATPEGAHPILPDHSEEFAWVLRLALARGSAEMKASSIVLAAEVVRAAWDADMRDGEVGSPVVSRAILAGLSRGHEGQGDCSTAVLDTAALWTFDPSASLRAAGATGGLAGPAVRVQAQAMKAAATGLLDAVASVYVTGTEGSFADLCSCDSVSTISTVSIASSLASSLEKIVLATETAGAGGAAESKSAAGVAASQQQPPAAVAAAKRAGRPPPPPTKPPPPKEAPKAMPAGVVSSAARRPPPPAGKPKPPPPRKPEAAASPATASAPAPAPAPATAPSKPARPPPPAKNPAKPAAPARPPPPPRPTAPPSAQQPGGAVAAAAVASGMVAVKDHPDYARFFKFLRMKVPKGQIQMNMEQEGKDVALLDTPEKLIPL